MIKKILLSLVVASFFNHVVIAQTDSVSAIADIKKFQDELTEEYKTKGKSPLEPEDLKKFRGHEFFPINLKFRVVARLKRTENEQFFQMPTTLPRKNLERIFGMIIFSIDDVEYQLPVYQSQSLMATDQYKDYLFFPFTDLTNGDETYDGGRYIDLRIPQGDEIVIDFNKAYNPYCAYSSRYSCPLVPAKNRMEIKVLAGIKHKKKEN